MLQAKSTWPPGPMASQGHGRSQSHTSHSITRDGVTGKCQQTHKEEPSAHRIIRLPEGGAILHSHDSSLSTHTLFHCILESIFLSHLFNVFNCVVCSGSHVCLRMYCIITGGHLEFATVRCLRSVQFYPHGNVMGHWFVAWSLISWFTTWSLSEHLLPLALHSVFVVTCCVTGHGANHVPHSLAPLEDQDAIWSCRNHVVCFQMCCSTLPLLYKWCSTLSCYAILRGQYCCVSAWKYSCIYACALDKDGEKDGESKRKATARVQRRYVSASDREDSPEGRSQPFSTENDTWLLWLLSSPVSLRPQTQASNKHWG